MYAVRAPISPAYFAEQLPARGQHDHDIQGAAALLALARLDAEPDVGDARVAERVAERARPPAPPSPPPRTRCARRSSRLASTAPTSMRRPASAADMPCCAIASPSSCASWSSALVVLERAQLARAPRLDDAAAQLVDGVRVELLGRTREQLRHQDLARPPDRRRRRRRRASPRGSGCWRDGPASS